MRMKNENENKVTQMLLLLLLLLELLLLLLKVEQMRCVGDAARRRGRSRAARRRSACSEVPRSFADSSQEAERRGSGRRYTTNLTRAPAPHRLPRRLRSLRAGKRPSPPSCAPTAHVLDASAACPGRVAAEGALSASSRSSLLQRGGPSRTTQPPGL